MIRRITKRVVVFALVLATTVTFTDMESIAKAKVEATKTITVTPLSGQWKYFGQKKTFLRDENFYLSDDTAILDNEWKLGIESEAVGEQNFVLSGTTTKTVTGAAISGGAVTTTENLVLAANAPKFTIKEYKTAAKVEEETEVRTSTEAAVVKAPKGYVISPEKKDGNWDWDSEFETSELTQGANVITYYLRSNTEDDTRNAIDQTAKTTTLRVDSIAPELTSLTGGSTSTDVTADGGVTGSEPGIFYYMAVPANYSTNVTQELIRANVSSNIGIVGYGRVDGTSKAASFSMKGLSALTDYKIYAYMEDDAGNISEVKSSNVFTTDKMSLKGTVGITGIVAVDNILTATPAFSSVDTGTLTYQWYRIKLAEDAQSFEEVLDETGGAAADDLVADDSDDEEEDEEEDTDEEDEEDTETDSLRKLSISTKALTSIDGATEIKGATSNTYQVTKEDIGYRLIARVDGVNYSEYIAGSTDTFVPKLVPTFTTPTLTSRAYYPTKKLSAIALPTQWSWVDDTIVPVYGNSGYRAKYTPADNHLYKSVVVRIKVPLTKRLITKKMAVYSKKKAYAGKAIKGNVKVKDAGKTLKLNRDYKVTYKNNRKLGKATVTLRGIGNYKNAVTVTYQIVKKSVKNVTWRYHSQKVYTGRTLYPGLVLKNGSVKMKKDKDYRVVYKNNVSIGTGKAVITGIGNYNAKKTIRYQIIPAKPSITKVTRATKAFRMQMKDRQEVTGYRIYVSTTRSFAKSKTSEYSTTGNKFGIKGLLKKKVYYVRVKSYVSKSGASYVSSYSGVKKVKTK